MNRAAAGIMNMVELLKRLVGLFGFSGGGGGGRRGGDRSGGGLSLVQGLEGMGAALAGRGMAGALIPSQALANTYVSSIASGITGKLAAFLKAGGLIGLVYQAVDITRTFEESGAMAGIINAARAIISAIAAAVGTVAGTALAGPLGGLAGGLAFGTIAARGTSGWVNRSEPLPQGPDLFGQASAAATTTFPKDSDQDTLGGMIEGPMAFYNRNIRNVLGGGNTG